ncbi:MAG: tetratricopeptide repeat protein [Rhodoferax sp.]|nr:tetratricopeptide repeat protein [Rhodoferax sp.]
MKQKILATIQAAVSALAIAAPTDDAKKLLTSGNAAGAAALLESTLPQHLADVEHNYLLGIALLDSGKPGTAVFAFERVLAIEPGNAMARAELARAMIALMEYEAARAELLQVRSGPIPADVAARVDSLLQELERAISAKAVLGGAAVFSGYLEAEIGYDSNFNTAVNANSVLIPLFGVAFPLVGPGRSQSSSLVGVNGGFSGQKRIGDGVDIYGGIDGRARYYPRNGDFAPVALSVGGGVRLTRGGDQYSVGISQFTYYIGGAHNDDQLGVYGQWQRQLDRSNTVGAFAQYARVNHPIIPALNTNLYLLGGMWARALDGNGAPHISLTGWLADDRERGADPTVGRSFFGAKLAGDYTLQARWKLFGSLTAQASRYGGQSVFFGVKRKDERYDLNIGAAYQADKLWTYTAQLTHTRNQSTVAINDFSRDLLLLTARRNY